MQRSAVIALVAIGVALHATPSHAQEVGTIATVAGFSSDGSATTPLELNGNSGIAVDSAGNLYFAEVGANRISKLDTAGIVTILAGRGTAGYSGDGALATAAELQQPGGVAVDASGNIYVADSLNHVVRRIDPTGIITTVAGRNCEASDPQCVAGDGGPATSATFVLPNSVAIDSAGNLYISDSACDDGSEACARSVRRVDAASGVITTVADGAHLQNPHGLAVDSADNLYVADAGGGRVFKIEQGTGVTIAVAGNGDFGFSGDNGAATEASLSFPSSIAFDLAGNLYVADSSNRRIRRIDSGGTITTVAGDGCVLHEGSECPANDGGPATSASLGYPRSIAISSDGTLYISDPVNARIRAVAAASPIPPAAGN